MNYISSMFFFPGGNFKLFKIKTNGYKGMGYKFLHISTIKQETDP